MKLGLALSGGGIRGVAHLGIFKALEEFDIKPDIISGVSAGAFAGAFYCAGYSPEVAMEFVQKTRFFSIFNYAYGKPGLLNTDRLRKVLAEYFPEDSFSTLQKDLYIVATDMIAAKQKEFHEGSLLDAIVASCAFPGIYSPVELDGVLYGDGGVINNLPSDVITDKCDKLIGIFVNPIKKMDKSQLKSVMSLMERAYGISKIAFNRDKYNLCDWLIQPDKLCNYRMFDTRQKKAEEIFKIGYEEGLWWGEKIAKEIFK